MNQYVETFKSADGASEALIAVTMPCEKGGIAQMWITPEVARNLVLELFDAYLSVT